MYKGSKGTCTDIITRLTTEANNCDFKASQSLENRKKLSTIQKELDGDLISKEIAETGLSNTKELIKQLIVYLNEKKAKGLSAVYSAIYSARSIIPDTANLTLVVDKEAAYLANDKGFNVNSVEGSAFRAILSLFIRDRLLKSTNYIQTQFYDEAMATLDVENSVEASRYLELLAENSPMIVTEQKDAVFEAIDHTAYLFRKVEGKSTVRRERFDEERVV